MANGRYLKEPRLTRRSVLAKMGAVVPASMLGGSLLAGPARAQGKTINFMTWGGGFGESTAKAFSKPYEAASGNSIRDITPYNWGRFQNSMRNNNPEGFDLVWFSDEVEPALAGEMGMAEELNYDWIPNAGNAIPSARQKYGVAPYVTIYVNSYNTGAFGGRVPTSWADFWDVKNFPGPRSLGTWVCGVLEAALMADGVAPEALYPLDEDRAFAKLDELRPDIRVFHDTSANTSAQQMLAQGEVVMMLSWGSPTVDAYLTGAPVNVVHNQGFYFSPLIGIAKGSPNVRECHDWMNLLFDTDRQLVFVTAFPTSPANPAVLPMLSEDLKSMVATGNLSRMVNFSVDYYLKNRDRLQKKYDAWRIL